MFCFCVQGWLDPGDRRARQAPKALRSRSCARVSAARCTRACASNVPSSMATLTGRLRTAMCTTLARRGKRATMWRCSASSRTGPRGSRSTATPRGVSAPTSVLLLLSSSTRCLFQPPSLLALALCVLCFCVSLSCSYRVSACLVAYFYLSCSPALLLSLGCFLSPVLALFVLFSLLERLVYSVNPSSRHRLS